MMNAMLPAAGPAVLDAGDSASYLADCEHLYEALAPGTTGLILMSYPSALASG